MTQAQKEALSYAGKMLAMRMMTRKQLIDKLLEKGHAEDDADFAADQMEMLRALDDQEYAHQFVKTQSAKGYGAMRIRQDLRLRGVDPELIEAALDELTDQTDWMESFIRSRMRGETLDRHEAKKIADALARKGYLWEDISPIMQKFLEEN